MDAFLQRSRFDGVICSPSAVAQAPQLEGAGGCQHSGEQRQQGQGRATSRGRGSTSPWTASDPSRVCEQQQVGCSHLALTAELRLVQYIVLH